MRQEDEEDDDFLVSIAGGRVEGAAGVSEADFEVWDDMLRTSFDGYRAARVT